MLQSCTNGYLFGKEFRKACILFCCISISILVCFLVVLWYDLVSSASVALEVLVLVFIFSAGILCVICVGYKRFNQISAEYICKANYITNTYMQDCYCVNLEDGYFVSRLSITFFLGKGSTQREFIMLSNGVIQTGLEDRCGIEAIVWILHNGMVLLPWENSVMQWFNENVHIETIPFYPNAAHMPPKSVN